MTGFNQGGDNHIELVIAVDIGDGHRPGKPTAGDKIDNGRVVVCSVPQQHRHVDFRERAGHEHYQVLLGVAVHVTDRDGGNSVSHSGLQEECLRSTKSAGAVSEDNGGFSTCVLSHSE